MKLLYILATFPFSGHKEEFFFPEIYQLSKDGNEVVVVPRTNSGDLLSKASTLDLDWQLFKPLLSLSILKCLLVGCLLQPGKMLRMLRLAFHSKDVTTFLRNVLVIPKAVWLAREAQARKIDHIHAHWATTTSTLAMFTSDLSGIPWSFTAHRGDIVANNLLELKLRKASFTRFISESGIRLARERTNLQPDGKWKMIRMGVKSGAAVVSREVCRSCLPVILCPANLQPVKGHTYLLKAIALLKRSGVNTRLLLAGDGPTRKILERQVKDLGLAKDVEFMGHVPQERLFDLYRKGTIDLVVLPSVDLGEGEHEGVPVALLEAMAYRIPTISTTTGGIPESLGSGECILVAEKDPEGLSIAIASLLHDESLRNATVVRGEKRILEEFDITAVARKMEECFRQFTGVSLQSLRAIVVNRNDRNP